MFQAPKLGFREFQARIVAFLGPRRRASGRRGGGFALSGPSHPRLVAEGARRMLLAAWSLLQSGQKQTVGRRSEATARKAILRPFSRPLPGTAKTPGRRKWDSGRR